MSKKPSKQPQTKSDALPGAAGAVQAASADTAAPQVVEAGVVELAVAEGAEPVAEAAVVEVALAELADALAPTLPAPGPVDGDLDEANDEPAVEFDALEGEEPESGEELELVEGEEPVAETPATSVSAEHLDSVQDELAEALDSAPAQEPAGGPRFVDLAIALDEAVAAGVAAAQAGVDVRLSIDLALESLGWSSPAIVTLALARLEALDIQVEPRPTFEQLRLLVGTGAVVEMRMRRGELAPQLIAGQFVHSEYRRYSIDSVADCGESHLRALAIDGSVHVRLVE